MRFRSLTRAVAHVSGELVEDSNDDLWLCVADGKSSFIISGNGDVIEPEDDIMAIGSGGS